MRKIWAFLSLLLIVVAVPAIGARADSTSSRTDGTSPTLTPTTPLLSARRFPGSLQSTASDPELVASLEQYFAKVIGTSCAVVEIDGRRVFTRQSRDSLAPASTLKLATALGALEILGRDHVFTTRMVSTEPVKNGRIDGDLYVVGGGDPLLITSGYKSVFEDPDQFYEELRSVVDALADAGVASISGDLIGDDSRYESTRWIPTWPTRYQIGGTVGPLSALIVNDGSTGYSDSPNDPTTNRRAGDSPMLFVQTLKTLMRSRGITVSGDVSLGRAPEDASEIASFESVPLSEVLGEMLTNSDNTTAELVTREIGFVAKGDGSTAAGVSAIRESLTSQGFDISSLVMLDGSGLDTGNRMNCELGIALADAVADQPDLLRSLPVGGRNGTLRKRMLSTASTGRVRAKTGTLNSVNALVGFVDAPQGSTISFSFLHNGNDSRTTGVADGFTDRLVPYGKAIKVSALEPLAAR